LQAYNVQSRKSKQNWHVLFILFQNGESGLHAAALFGHVSVVKQLISAGADLTLRNQEGATPLQLAQEAKQTAVVEYLCSVPVDRVNGTAHEPV
jgi:ankyrin repeat protein